MDCIVCESRSEQGKAGRENYFSDSPTEEQIFFKIGESEKEK